MIWTLLALCLAAQAHGAAISSATVSDPHELLQGRLARSGDFRRLTVFPERLVYDVSWGLLSVGQATMVAAEIVDFNDHPAYHIVSEATSNRFCDTFYKVRDINESWLDARSLSSLGYAKKLREGSYYRDEWVLYDGGDFLAKIIRQDGSFDYKAGTAPISVQDILSSLYYIRSQDLTPGNEIVLDVNTKENWPLVIRVIRRETVRVPAGTFSTILVEPAMRQEGLFIQKGRKLQVWLTDDGRKMPVLMKVEVFFGHISAKLVEM